MSLNQLIFNTVESVILELDVLRGSLQKELEFILSYTNDIDTNYTLKAKKKQITQIEILVNEFKGLMDLALSENKKPAQTKMKLEACALVHGITPNEINRFLRMSEESAIMEVIYAKKQGFIKIPESLIKEENKPNESELYQLNKGLKNVFMQMGLKN